MSKDPFSVALVAQSVKAVSDIIDEHYAQVYNYLKASEYKLGLLINFGNISLDCRRIPCTTKWISVEDKE